MALGGSVSKTLALCPHPDYAEALINPIKHVSLMDQRAKQLAALIGESEVSQGRLQHWPSHHAAGCGVSSLPVGSAALGYSLNFAEVETTPFVCERPSGQTWVAIPPAESGVKAGVQVSAT